MTCKQYLYNVAVALDRLGNAILWGRYSETLSSRTFRNAVKG